MNLIKFHALALGAMLFSIQLAFAQIEILFQ